jgi:hypothetical protein
MRGNKGMVAPLTAAMVTALITGMVAVGGTALAASITAETSISTTAVQVADANTQAVPDNSGCEPPGNDAYHWYVMVTECGKEDYKGVSATLTLPNSPLNFDKCNDDTPYAHSNGQITLQESLTTQNAIEVSWVVYPGDTEHVYLQVGRIIGPQSVKSSDDYYPSYDWVPYPKSNSNRPQPLNTQLFGNAVLDAPLAFKKLALILSKKSANITGKSTIELAIRYSVDQGGQWQVFVGGHMIGHYPDKSTWRPNGFHPKRAAWWGEVGSHRSQSPYSSCGSLSGSKDGNESCTDMGNGTPGVQGGAAAGFSNMKTETKVGFVNASRQIYVADPVLYNSDKYEGKTGGAEGFSGDSFHYGGHGRCAGANQGAVKPCMVFEGPPRPVDLYLESAGADELAKLTVATISGCVASVIPPRKPAR